MEHLDLDQLRTELDQYVVPAWEERYEVRRETPDSGITGYLVKNSWRDVSFAVRQRELNDLLEGKFGEGAGDVSLILTFTPEEYEAWAEDQLAPS